MKNSIFWDDGETRENILSPLFKLVWTSLLVAGLGVRAKGLLKFLEDPSFAEGFGGKAV